MKSKCLLALLALGLCFPSLAQMNRYSSMSSFAGWPRVVLFEDGSERSRELYQALDDLSVRAKAVSFIVINYDEMSPEDQQKAATLTVDGPSTVYVAWDYFEEGFALRPDFDLQLLKPLVEDLEDLYEGIQLYRDQEPKRAKKKLKKLFEAEPLFFPEAGLFLGLCCEQQGKFDEAANYFSAAGRYGVADALYRLGYYYETGRSSAGVNQEMARILYHKAAQLGHENAQIRLSLLQ